MALEWTSKEDYILLENYQNGAEFVKGMLENRSLQSIYHRAGFLKAVRRSSKGWCRKCGIKLTSVNWYVSSYNRCDYICKKCIQLNNKELRYTNPKVKKWGSNNTLHTNGKQYLVRKRERPIDNSCELCGRVKHTVYHHFGDIEYGKPILGIWVCKYCHPFAELYDQGFCERYAILKERVLNE